MADSPIKSFVRREGKITQAQKNALEVALPLYELPLAPIDPSVVFAREAACVLDIGFGMGASLFELAKKNSHINYFGVEVFRPGVGRLLMDVQNAGLSNVRVWVQDVMQVLAECLPDNSLDAVLLFFPDPWHKKRHHKRRLVRQEFLDCLSRVLKPGGVFHAATDWDHYAVHIETVMQQFSDFSPCEPLERPVTKYEERGRRLGHKVWDLAYQIK